MSTEEYKKSWNPIRNALHDQGIDPTTFVMHGLSGAGLGQSLLAGRQQRIDVATQAAERAAASRKSQQELEKFQTQQRLKAREGGFQSPVFTGTGYGMEPLVQDTSLPQPNAGFSEKTSDLYDKSTKQVVTRMVDGAGNIHVVDALGNPWEGNPSDLMDPRYDPELQRDIAAGKAGGGVQGTTQATAETQVESAKAELDFTKDIIGQFKKHEGSDAFLSSAGAGRYALGTDMAGAAAIYDQLVGKAGLAAYEKVKGAGQITEKETEMATNALIRIQNLKQGSGDWWTALDDYEKALELGYEKIKGQAGGSESPVLSDAAKKYL